jgi:polyphosphate glucokinase
MRDESRTRRDELTILEFTLMKKNATSITIKPTTKPPPRKTGVRTLAIDVGGTGVKAIVLDERGTPLTERNRVPTPKKATPGALIGVIRKLARALGGFDRVSVGFPGVVKDGIVYTAANLGKGWKGFELERELRAKLDAPVRVGNDADVQGLASVSGHGLELVITLGTGFGSVLFANGTRIHMELGHHPFHKGKTYEDELGIKAFKKKGRKKWNKLLIEAIADLKKAFNYDRLYVGGGDTKYVDFKLPPDVIVVSNDGGMLGGIKLWHEKRPAERAAGRARANPPAAAAALGSPPVAIQEPHDNGVAPDLARGGAKASAKSRSDAAKGA